MTRPHADPQPTSTARQSAARPSLTAPPSSDPLPQVITCRSTADLLAALPHLLGFVPSDSVVAVCFSGRRSGQALRLDLPPDETPASIASTVTTLCAALASLHRLPNELGERGGPPGSRRSRAGQGIEPGAGPGGGRGAARSVPESEPLQAVAIVVVTRHRFGGSRSAPWGALAAGIERALHAASVEIRELCCRAADGWASYGAPDIPPGGHPLEDIAAAPVSLAAALRGDTVPEHSELGAIPAPAPERAAAISRLLAESSVPGGTPPPQSPTPASANAAAPGAVPASASPSPSPSPPAEVAATAALLRSDTPASVDECVRVIRTLAQPEQWVGVVLGILLSPARASALMNHPRTGAKLALLTSAPTDPGEAGYPELRAFVASVSPEFTERTRLGVVHERLRTAISECPSPRRVPLYALSALVWWLSGTQSVAQRHVDAAREIDERHPLVHTVEQLIAVPSHIAAAEGWSSDA